MNAVLAVELLNRTERVLLKRKPVFDPGKIARRMLGDALGLAAWRAEDLKAGVPGAGRLLPPSADVLARARVVRE